MAEQDNRSILFVTPPQKNELLLGAADQALTAEELQKIDAYWQACNYLCAGMIYLHDNPLLREPLRPEHIKNRLLGHWSSDPGQTFSWVHLNRVIRADHRKHQLRLYRGSGQTRDSKLEVALGGIGLQPDFKNLLLDEFFRFPMGRLCQFESFGGVLQSHFRVFMSGLMVALSVMHHGRAVSVSRELVKFGGFLMRIVHRA